nr:hypothetical protein [Tanacetum cinerariifolium]
MSSDNAQSAVTYTSISSDSNGPSWGILLMNADEFLEIDPYEEYHAPSDDDIQVKDQPHANDASPTTESPRYISDSDSIEEDDDEDPKEDPEEDPSEEHEPENDDKDPEEDPNEKHEPEDEDTKEPSENSDETEPFEEDETAVTPPPPRHRRARISAPLGHRAAMIHRRDDIPKGYMPPQRKFAFTAPSPGYDVAKSYVVVAARAPRGQYDFVDTVEAGQGLICSPGHDACTIYRAADRAEDVGYESKYFYTQLHDAQIDRRDIRLEIDVVRGQKTAYETELQEVHQAYLSFEAWNRALLARLETLETHVSCMEWLRHSAVDLAVTQMMRIHALEARARTDTAEEASSSC